MNNLELSPKRLEKYNLLLLSPQPYKGRLSANRGPELAEDFKKVVTQDDYAVLLDMKNVVHLDSGGNMPLNELNLSLLERGGSGIHLFNINSYPRRVLRTTAYDKDFGIYLTEAEAIEACILLETNRRYEKGEISLPILRENGVQFTVFESSKSQPSLKVVGNISNVLSCKLMKQDIFSRRFSKTEYSIGLGAQGESVEECMNLLGEMITIGGTLVTLPTNGEDKPEFIIPVFDTGEVTIYTGFNVALEGKFNDIIIVECLEKAGITLTELYEFIFRLAKKERTNFEGLVSIAFRGDVEGVRSTCVTIPPIEERKPKGGGLITDDENRPLYMATCNTPKYQGETILGFGVGIDPTTKQSAKNKDAAQSIFYHNPADENNTEIRQHTHGVICKNTPWIKNLIVDKEIRKIVDKRQFIDMRHLLYETEIKRAVIGVSYISKVIFEDT